MPWGGVTSWKVYPFIGVPVFDYALTLMILFGVCSVMVHLLIRLFRAY